MIQRGKPLSVLAFTVARGKIVEIDVLADPERLRQLDLVGFDDGPAARTDGSGAGGL